MTKLEHALHLASLGFHVFPITENKKAPPAINDFTHFATRNEETIKMWWAANKNLNIGIATQLFKESEALLVIDVDQKEGKMGEDSIFRLEAIDGLEFPATLEQSTPSGGRHIIYKTPIAVKQGVNVLGPGLDIRSRGGYIVGSGSSLSNGSYLLNDGRISEAPEWLVSRCGRSSPKSNDSTKHMPSNVNQDHAEQRSRHYLEAEAPEAIQGSGGNHTTFAVAAKIRDFGIDEIKCVQLMGNYYNDQKCRPHWAHDDLVTIIANAYRYGENEPGNSAPESVFTPIKDQQPIKPQKILKTFSLFRDIKPVTEGPYLMEKLLRPGEMSVLYGDTSIGKSFFALDMALHIAAGRPWFDRQTPGGAVFYIAAEGGWGINNRIAAWKKYHNLENADLPLALLKAPMSFFGKNNDTQQLIKMVKEFENQVNAAETSLIVIDTLARTIGGGNENNPDDMGEYVANIDLIRHITKAHVMIIHHTGKDQSRGARGHSSLKCATDTEIEITKGEARATKQRDVEIGPSIYFGLKQIEILESLTSMVVIRSNTSAVADFSKMALKPGTQKWKCFKALQNALDLFPIEAPEELGLMNESHATLRDDHKEEFMKLTWPNKEITRAMESTFYTTSARLAESGHIKMNEKYAWI